MYARCGKLDLGERVFSMMNKKAVVSWNSLISGYGIHGYGKRAIQIFEDMINHGVSLSHISFVSVLGACSHADLVEEGKILFDSMVKEHGLYPSVEHYAPMVDLLGRANRLDEAAKVIDSMRIEPGAKVWGALLGSRRISVLKGSPQGMPRLPLSLGISVPASVLREWAEGFAGVRLGMP
ncbi:hypothetical protein ACFX13_040451 [Malus domestica]